MILEEEEEWKDDIEGGGRIKMKNKEMILKEEVEWKDDIEEGKRMKRGYWRRKMNEKMIIKDEEEELNKKYHFERRMIISPSLQGEYMLLKRKEKLKW